MELYAGLSSEDINSFLKTFSEMELHNLHKKILRGEVTLYGFDMKGSLQLVNKHINLVNAENDFEARTNMKNVLFLIAAIVPLPFVLILFTKMLNSLPPL